MAYTAQWTQFDWSAPSVSTAVHPGDTDGWTAYDNKSSTITYIPGTGLRFESLAFNWNTTDNTVSTSGFNHAGAFWNPDHYFHTTADKLVPYDVFSQADGVFDTDTYVSGIPGITKVSATAFTINTGAAPNNGVYNFSSVNISNSVTVTVTGSNPLVIKSLSYVVIGGTINARGQAGGWTVGGAGGPGGYSGGNRYYAGGGPGGGGYAGGGGGYGGAGGGNGYGSGGAANGTITIYPNLYGGSGGSAGNGGGAGGGGGGAVAIFSRSSITIAGTALIDVSGGAGSAQATTWGGGGGAGGALVLAAPLVTGGGALTARGGNGGADNGAGGGGGRIRIEGSSISAFSVSVGAGTGTGSGSAGGAGTSSTTIRDMVSAVYTSGIFDTGGTFDLYDIAWSSFIPAAGGSIVTEVRAGNTAAPDGTWTVWAPFANGGSLGGSMDYRRYIQWRSSFSTVDPSTSPVLYDLTVRYLGYDQNWRSLVSSVYDTTSSSNSFRKVTWTENAPSPADAQLQLRTSPDARNWTDWLGPGGAGTYFTDPAGGETVPYALRDGVDDRYFQYKLQMKGSGNNTPTVSVATFTYGSFGIPVLTGLQLDSSTQITLQFSDTADDEDDFRVSTASIPGAVGDVGAIITADKPGTGPQAGPVSGLSPNTYYYFRLRAHETQTPGGGYSSFSNELSTYTLAARPIASLQSYEVTQNSVRVFWDANNNPAGQTFYFPERATSEDFSTGLFQAGWTNQLDHTFSSLALGTTYYFRVKARNVYGIETGTITLRAAQAVADPVPGSPSFVGVWPSSAALQWGANGNGVDTQYRVRRNGDGAVNWWPLDGSGADVAGGRGAYCLGGPGYVAGKSGQALSFNGAAQHCQTSQDMIVTGASPRTLSFWFYPTANGYKQLVYYGVQANGQAFGVMLSNANRLYFVGQGADLTCNTVVSLNSWHHAAVTYDGATLRCYYDGNPDGSAALSLNTSASPLYIAKNWDPSNWGFFQGYLDEIGLAPRALSASEIMALYTGTRTYFSDSGGSYFTGVSSSMAGMSQDGSYSFWVRAANPSGDPAANWISLGSTVTPAAQPSYSAAPVMYSSGAYLQWGAGSNPASPLASYVVEYSLDSGFSSPVRLPGVPDTGNSAGVAGYMNTGTSGSDYPNSVYVLRLPDNRYRVYYGRTNGSYWQIYYKDTTDTNPPSAANMPSGAGTYLNTGASTSDQAAYPSIVRLPDGKSRIFYSRSNGSYWQLYYKDTTDANPPDSANTPSGAGTYLNTGTSTSDHAYQQEVLRLGSGKYRIYYARSNGSYQQIYYKDTTNTSLPDSANTPSGVGTFLNIGTSVTDYPHGPKVMPLPSGKYRVIYPRYNGSYWQLYYKDTTDANPPDSANIASGTGAMMRIGSTPMDHAVSLTFIKLPDRYRVIYVRSNNYYQMLYYKDVADLTTDNYLLADGLTPMTTYYFRVGSVSSAGTTSWLDLGSAATKIGRPGFSFFSPGSDRIDVNWTDPNPLPAEFYVERSTVSDFSSGVMNSGWLPDGTTHYVFAGLGASTEYYFRAKAREASLPVNESSWEAFPPQATLPNPPAPMSHTFVSSASVSLLWTANGNETGTQYYAERATDAGFTQNVGNTGWISHPTVSANVTGLVPNTNYFFRVKARNAGGVESPWASLPQARTFANVPGAPSSGQVLGDRIRLDWQMNSNPAGTEFQAEIALASDPYTAVETSAWVTSANKLFTGLAADTTYYLRVKARNAALDEGLNSLAPGAATWSAVISTRTNVPPAVPTSLAVDLSGVSPAQTDRLHVSWLDNSSTENGFTLERSADGADFSWTLGLAAGTTEYLNIGLVPNTSYYYRVKAYNSGGGDSAYSNTSALHTRAAVPVTPVLSQVSSATVSFGFGDGGNPGGTWFQVQLSTDPAFIPVQAASVTLTSPAGFAGLVPNSTYYVRARALNGNGLYSDFSAAVSTLTAAAPPAAPVFQSMWITSAAAGWGAGVNPGYTRYTAQVSTASDFTGTVVSSITRNASAEFTGLAPNATYYLRVRAANEANTPTAWFAPAAPSPTLAYSPGISGLPYVVNASSVTIFWDTAGNPPWTQYSAQRSGRDSSGFASVEDSSLWQTGRSSWTFSTPGLVSGATYYFRVKARNSAGIEAPFGAGNWVVLPSTQTKPSLPGLVPAEIFVSSMNARWVHTNQAGTPYLAEISELPDYSVITASSGWINDIAGYVFTGLNPNSRYYVRVRARNSSGLETATIQLYSEYTRSAAPGQPAGEYVRTGNTVTVNWGRNGNPDPETEYYAVVSSSSDFSYGVNGSGWLSANSWQFEGLLPGVEYFFRAKARNRNAAPLETAWEVLPSTITLPAPAAPSALGVAYVDADSTDRLNLSWTDASSDEAGFRVYESADGSVYSLKDTLGANPGTGPLNYLVLGLGVNSRYFYKVAAFNPNGEAYSAVISTFTRAALPSALDFSQVMTNSVRVNWGGGVNPAGTMYSAEISTMAGFSPLTASSVTALNTAHFTGIEANSMYYGRVRALNGSGVPTAYVALGSTQTIPLSVTIAVSDPGPVPMNQGQRFSFAKLVVTPSGSGAVLSGVAVDRIGTGVDADAARVGIWRDQNMDGSFQAGNDLEAGYAVFSSSRASVALNETLTAPATFFVTITAADNYMSWPGYTIGAAIASTASFSSPNSVIASMEPQAFTGTAVPVTKIADVLDIFGQSVVSMPNVSRGVYNTAFLKLTMNANRDRAYLNSVALQKLGTLSDANVAAIKIYYDGNKNGTLEPLAGDPLVSSGVDAFSSGQAVVQFVNPSTRAVTNDAYFVTLDIIETAPLGATIGVRVPSAASFQLMAGTPDSVTLGSTPTDSAIPAVSDPPNRVFVTATPMGVAQVAQGESKALLKLELTADTGIAVVNLVKVQRSSSSLNSDYTGLSFYRDNAPLGEYGGSDTFIASGAVVSGQVNFGMAESITFTSTKTYFVVAHMSPSANTLNQAGVLVQSGYITATSAQTTIVAGFPLNSGLSQITPTVDVVQVTPDASMAPGVAYQSDANVPMLGLRFKALSNAADVSSLMISQAGSAQDGDISALRLFRDNGDGTFDPGNDTPVSGAYALSNGTAAVSFSSIQNITTAESLYFIAADIAGSAVPGRSSQLRLINPAAINVLAPDIVSSTFPILSNVVNLEKLPAVVLVSTAGLAPAAAEAGTQNIKLVRIGLRSNQSTSQLNSLALVRSGGADADISKVALHWDANSNGLLEASELVSSGTFTGGLLTLPFGGLSRSLTVSTKTYYVTMDLAAAAPIGASLGVNFTNLSVQNPDTVESGRLPFGSGGVLVSEPPVQLHSHFESGLAASITQGDRSVLVASVTLQAAAYTVSWNGIQLLRAGSGYDSDISAVRIYRDNGNGAWGGAAQETEIASGQFASGALTLAFSTETISASPRLYYIAVDVSETADPGKTFGINLPAASYMKMADPDYGDITDFPFSSSLASIAPTVDTLETVPVPLSLAPLLTQGDHRRSIGKITLRAATNAVSLSGIRFLQTGTMSDDSLAEAILYKDDGDGLYNQTLDTPVTSPTGPSAGILQLAVSPVQVLGQASQTFWLAISVSTSAPVGTTFSLDCPSTAYFTVSSPDLVDASAFPFSFSLAGTLQDRPDQLMVRIEDKAPTSIYQGINATAMARLSFWASEDRVELNRVRVDINGTVSQSDIARAVLYADSDGNRLLDPAYDALAASGTFSAGSVWLEFISQQVITPSTAVYFLAYDIAPTAVIGGEAGAGIMDNGYFDRSAPDTVAAVTALQTRQAVIRDPRVPVPPGIAMLLADGKLTIEELTYAPYETMLDFKWDGTVYQGSLERIEYYVGAAPATGASAWTPAGLNKDVRITSLNLAHGATYYLSLRAKNVLGAFYSDIVSQRFVVDSYKPLIPPGAQAREEAGGVKLTWPAAAVGPSGVAHYVVEERAAGSPVWVTVTTTSARSMVVSRTGISVQSAKPAGAYYYRVSPVNNAGVSGDPTEPLAVKIDIGSLASISGASAYPNPFDSRKTQVTVAFTLNKASPVKLAIYDVFGVKVKEISAAGVEGENLVRWDGSGASGKVSKGVYLCVIKAAGDSKLVKIAVKH